MARLEDLTRGATVKGILPERLVTIEDVKWHGSTVVEVTYKDASGRPANELLYWDREPTLEIVTQGTPFSFDGDGSHFCLASEARRISLAYLFDPLLAPSTRPSSSRYHTRPPRCTASCCRASRCGSSWPTTPVPGRPSWLACSSKS
jgi:hypothetical protein